MRDWLFVRRLLRDLTTGRIHLRPLNFFERSQVNVSALRDCGHKRPLVSLAKIAHLASRRYQQIPRIADVTRCEDKFADFELLYHFPLQQTSALFFVECNHDPILLPDFPQYRNIVSRAGEKFAVALIPDSCAVQLFDQCIVVEVVIEIECETFRRRFSLLRARSPLRFRLRIDHSLLPAQKSRLPPSSCSSGKQWIFWN